MITSYNIKCAFWSPHPTSFQNFEHFESFKCIEHKTFHDKRHKKEKKTQLFYSNMLFVVLLYVYRPFCPKNLKLSWKEDPKKRKIRCRYNWTMSKNKELFQLAGKKKTPDFMPNGIVGTKFGQGLPPVKVNWKKNRRNWQRHQFDFFIRAWKIAISRPIFIVKATFTLQQTPNKLPNKTCPL